MTCWEGGVSFKIEESISLEVAICGDEFVSTGENAEGEHLLRIATEFDCSQYDQRFMDTRPLLLLFRN